MAEKNITIRAGEVTLEAVLNDTQTAEAVWNALPIEASGNRWGDEIYFSIPVDMGLEDGREVVEKGDLAYWPTGTAFCIFWGPTPMSQGDEIRPASAVTVFGKVTGDVTQLSSARSGVQVVVEKGE